jgi:lactoylglutathione lyase
MEPPAELTGVKAMRDAVKFRLTMVFLALLWIGIPEVLGSPVTQFPIPLADRKSFAILMEKREVLDLHRAIEFYTQALSMSVIGRYAPDDSSEEVFVGYGREPCRVKVVLASSADKGDEVPKMNQHTGLIVQVPNLSEVLQKVQIYGGKVTVRPIVYPEFSMKIAVAQDPDGHRLELIEFK